MNNKFDALKKHANSIRKNILRAVYAANSGHPGGSLSSADIMSVLYFNHLKHDPKNPWTEDRDRVIFSKGHASPLLYSVLAETGYIESGELDGFRKLHSRLQGHPVYHKCPGVEATGGPLGQGFSFSIGMALGLRLAKSASRVYTLLGDGECQEGLVWEAAMAAGHYKLSNLCAILDYNGLQIDGDVEKIMGIAPIADKFRAFNFNVLEIDGHDYAQIDSAFGLAKSITCKPTMIIAHTVKGKGVSFMENNYTWHGKAPNKEQYEQAIAELEKAEVK
ncbi:MAG TPA: transketolase [Candidatus Wallbacteria bacterium]|nr:transketolase [Candidatus Wallbacteria bacterium]